VFRFVAVLLFLPSLALAQDGGNQCSVTRTPAQPPSRHDVLITGQYQGKDFAFKISVDGKPAADPSTPSETLAADCSLTS
jgi:hypothetical protein